LKRFLRWLPVALLLVAAVASTAVAFTLSGDRVAPRARAVEGERAAAVTPVLSARRVPTATGAPIADRRLDAALSEFVAAQDATTCLEVRDDQVLFSHRSTEPMIPASTQKLLTAAGVLLQLDPDTTFETVVVGPAIGSGGVLSGDLVIVGGGDPILATDGYAGSARRQPQIHTDFEVLADRLVEAGLTEVTGGVVGDESRYDTQRRLPIPEVWLPEDIPADVAGPLSALYVNDGFVAFPGDGQGTTEFVESLDPAAHAAQLLSDELRVRGVVIGADARSGASPGGVQPLARIESPPVRTILAEMLQESDNSTAELLLKELGLQTDRGGTSVGGAEALTAVLADAGLSVDGTRVLDGSGVANGNLTTCRLMAEVLADDRVGEVIVDGLAVAGETGTLSTRFRGTELAGNVRGKTGSLRVVSALAGQLDTRQGGALQFAYIINVEPGQAVNAELFAAQEQLARILFDHPDLPDPVALGPH